MKLELIRNFEELLGIQEDETEFITYIGAE
jgi:hypothetical protein